MVSWGNSEHHDASCRVSNVGFRAHPGLGLWGFRVYRVCGCLEFRGNNGFFAYWRRHRVGASSADVSIEGIVILDAAVNASTSANLSQASGRR